MDNSGNDLASRTITLIELFKINIIYYSVKKSFYIQ